MALLILLGLAAGGLHVPATALPVADAPALSHDCHGSSAADEAAPEPASNLPPCCPEGCDGACLAPATATALIAPAFPVGWKPVTPSRVTPRVPASTTPEGPTDPPRLRV